MPIEVEAPDGTVVEFPDDTPRETMRAAMQRRFGNPQPNPARAVASNAANRNFMRSAVPFGLGNVTVPLTNMLTSPARRQALGRSAADLARDAQQLPNVNWGQVGSDVSRSVSNAAAGAARDPLGTAGNIARAIPGALAEMTYRPFEREEEAQRQIDLARSRGMPTDQFADQANAATAQIGFNVAAPMIPLSGSMARAAGTGAAMAAPFALSRNNDRPLQERLPGAILETGGAALASGALQGAGNVLAARAAASERNMGRIQQRGVAADRANVRLPLAALEGRETAPYTMSLASSPVGGNVRQNLRQSVDDVGRRLNELADDTAPQTTRELAGESLQYDVNRFVNGPGRGRQQPQPRAGDPASISVRDWNVRDKAAALYDRVEEPILAAESSGAGQATADSSIEALRRINSRVRLADLGEIIHNPRLRRIAQALEGSGRRGRDSFQPAAMDDVAAMRTEIETARRASGSANQSLSTYVRRKGGLRDDRGDIRGMDPSGRGASSVLRGNGRTIDDMAIAAWEDGFFPGDSPPTAREFIDALDRDLRRPGSVTGAGDAHNARNSRDILSYYEQQGIDTSLSGSRLEQALGRLIGADQATPATISYEDLRALRSWVREAKGDPQLRGDIGTAQLAQLESALTRDIYASAEALGGPGTARNVQAVDRWYRTLSDRIDNTLTPIADAKNGALAIERVRQLARSRGSARELNRLRASVSEAQWRNTAATVLREMGQGADGNFSLARFISEYGGRNGMTAEGRRALFGGMGTLLDDLDNLREVAGYLDDVRGFTNWSNTGSNVQSFFTGAGGVLSLGAGLAGGQWHWALLMAAKLGLDRAAGHFLTNPAAVRWLRGVPKAGQSAPAARAHLMRLSEIVSRDPALAPILAAELSQGQSGEARGPANRTAQRLLPSP